MSNLTVGSLSGLASNDFVIDVEPGSKIVQPGSVLQVVQTVKTDTFSTNSTSFVDVTGLSATITPSSTANKIYVAVTIYGSSDGSGSNPKFALLRDSTAIGNGATAGSRVGAIGSIPTFSGVNLAQVSAAFQFLDSPSLASALTYKVQTRVQTDQIFINRSSSDTDNNQAQNSRLSSTITLMEIAG